MVQKWSYAVAETWQMVDQWPQVKKGWIRWGRLTGFLNHGVYILLFSRPRFFCHRWQGKPETIKMQTVRTVALNRLPESWLSAYQLLREIPPRSAGTRALTQPSRIDTQKATAVGPMSYNYRSPRPEHSDCLFQLSCEVTASLIYEGDRIWVIVQNLKERMTYMEDEGPPRRDSCAPAPRRWGTPEIWNWFWSSSGSIPWSDSATGLEWAICWWGTNRFFLFSQTS